MVPMTSSEQQSSLTPKQFLALPVILLFLHTIFSLSVWGTNFYIPFMILIFVAAFFVGVMIREVPIGIMERKKLVSKQVLITFIIFTLVEMINEIIRGNTGYDILINAITYAFLISVIQWFGAIVGRGVNLPEHQLPSEIYLDEEAKPKKRKKKKKKKNRSISKTEEDLKEEREKDQNT